MNKLNEYIKSKMQILKFFNLVDLSALKIYLLSLGVILGMYFPDTFLDYKYWIFSIFAVTLLHLLIKLNRYNKK